MNNIIEVKDKFVATIDNLLILNKEFRQVINPATRQIASPAEYAFEFCTVACDVGRRIGKSHYIQQHADDTSLVVVATERHRLLVEARGFDVLTAEQVEADDFDDKVLGKKIYKTIFVDEPSLVFKKIDRHDFYFKLARSGEDQTFILLGT